MSGSEGAGFRQRSPATRRSLTVWFSEEAIAAWRAEPRTTRGGQPWYSVLAILTALILRAVFRLALRQTEGLIGSILRLLGLTLAVPDHDHDGVDAPRRHRCAKVAVLSNHQGRRPPHHSASRLDPQRP